MKKVAKERWLELCHLAIHEQDPDKFLAIVKELDRLLELTETRLRKESASTAGATS